MRRITKPVLFLALVPGLAHAHGGLSSLAVLPVLLAMAAGVFLGLWLLVWFLLRLFRKPSTEQQEAPFARRTHWLRDARIPKGLRALALAQYLLAFLFALGALINLAIPGRYHNDHIAESVQQTIYFGVLFAVLAIVSAGGYLAAAAGRGLRLGLVLGWLCLVNLGVSFIWRDGASIGAIVGFATGLAILLVLNGQREYFGLAPRDEGREPSSNP